MLELLYQALHARFGIVVSSSDVQQTKQRLYAARKKAMDTDLEVLQLRMSPVAADEIWILKANRKKEAPVA